MSLTLPKNPSLEHLRKQAKDLLSSYRKGEAEATARLASFPEYSGGKAPALHDAQFAIARGYGFASWPKLVAEVERRLSKAGITAQVVTDFLVAVTKDQQGRCQRLLDLYPGLPEHDNLTALACGDLERLKAAIKEDPSFVKAQQGENSWTPLEYCSYSRYFHLRPEAYVGMENCVRTLLEAGADPNSSHLWAEDGKSPLSALYGAAGETGHRGIVKLLLEAGPNPNDGESMYHSAQHNWRDILELLVAQGGDVDAKHSIWSNSPIFFLSGWRPSDHGYDDVLLGIEWLLEHGANPNLICYPQKSAETPLHCACRTYGSKLVDMFLAHGADPSIRRADGKTAYEVALLAGNEYAMEAIRRIGGAGEVSSGESAIGEAIQGRPSEEARSWVKDHPEDAVFSLSRMAEFGNAKGARALLELGAPPSGANDRNQTPLHFAGFCGQVDAVEALLEYGASLDVVEKDYDAQPLGWALHGFRWNHRAGVDYGRMFRLFVNAGASKEAFRPFIDAHSEEMPEVVGVLAPWLE